MDVEAGKKKTRRRLVTVVAALFVGLGIASVPSALAGDGGNDAPPLKNVILVSLDSVRADHVSAHGYARLTTPEIDNFLEQHGGFVFDKMTAVAPSCHPSHTTILSGLYPQQTGVPWFGEDLIVGHSNMDEEEEIEDLEEFQEEFESLPPKLKQKKTSAVMNLLKVPEDLETLATYLQGKGFRTGGFIGIWTVTKRFGYDRGFDVYEDKVSEYYGPKLLAPLLKYTLRTQRRQPSESAVDAALAFLEETPRDERAFVFLQLADTHVEYSAADEIRFDGESQEDLDRLRERQRQRYPDENYDKAFKKMKAGKTHFVLDEYDRSIKHSDAQIGRVLDYLEQSGRLDETLVVITADHGDSMGQHRYLYRPNKRRLFFEHSVYLWEETQHVPLVIFDPASRGEVSRRQINASQVDIVPTIVSRLGFDYRSFGTSALPGVDLLSMEDGPRPVYSLTFGRGKPGLLKYGRLNYPAFIGFRRGDVKFVVDQSRFKNPDKGRCFLYDLEADPDELVNQCDFDHPEIEERVLRYRSQLVDWYSASVAERFKKKVALAAVETE
jgi:arylsulfatase A-like enzyme